MLEDLRKELELVQQKRGNRELSPTRPLGGAVVEHRGKQVVNFGSWDLLGIATNSKVVRAVHSAIESGGVAVGAPRVGTGTRVEHVAAEARLAKFLGTESALIFPSKNQVIFTLFSALLNERDTVFTDELTQSPIADAALLVNAAVKNFNRAGSPPLLQLVESSRNSRRKILFVEALSPITGEVADLRAFAALCAREDIHLIVDESFALGFVGVRGAGGTEGSNLLPPFCIVGDLGQTLGLYGGFIAGPMVLISYLVERSQSLRLDAALPPFVAAGLEVALNFIELGNLAREELSKRARFINETLILGGVNPVSPAHLPIVSLRCQKLSQAKELADAMLERGFFVGIVTSQAVFSQAAYVRLLITVSHTERQLQSAAQALIELVPRVLRK